MHEDLWAGADLKLEYARFHLRMMQDALAQSEANPMNIQDQSAGAIVGRLWHTPFYAHFDAFLAAVRSVPDIIQCCFGEDRYPKMKEWFGDLAAEERARRQEFRSNFDSDYKAFREHALSTERDVSVHRTGVPSVIARVSSMFGVVHTGDPIRPVPTSELREFPNLELPLAVKATPVWPTWSDFYIGGQQLFPACQEYLASASALMTKAREIATQVHGENRLTAPLTRPRVRA